MSQTTPKRTSDQRITNARMRAAHADISERFGEHALAALEALGRSWGTDSSRELLSHWALLPEDSRDAIAATLGAVLLVEAVVGDRNGY